MSNHVVAPLMLFLIPALVLLVLGKSRQPTPADRKKLRWGFILGGIAFTYFGVAITVGTKLSARPEVVGVVKDLRQYNGRRSTSSAFKVANTSSQTATLTCPYSGNAILEGERVFVRYLEFDHSILQLEVLDGPSKGWTFSISAGKWIGPAFIAMGLLAFLCSYTCSRPKPGSS